MQKRFDVVLIEGAGGLLSPLGEKFDSRELIAALRATPMVVCPNRLGAVNQILLTLAALPRSVSRRARVVLMSPAKPDASTSTNAGLLAEFLDAKKIFCLPHFGRAIDPEKVLKDPPVRRRSVLVDEMIPTERRPPAGGWSCAAALKLELHTPGRRPALPSRFRRRVGGQERFAPRLVIFVKLQSLLQRLEFFHLGGGGEVNRPLGHFLRVGEIAGLGAGHAEHIEHERLRAAGQGIGLGGEHERGFPVANLRIVIGGQHVGGVGEDLKIIRVEPQRRAKLINRPGIAALFEQRLPMSKCAAG
jgi:hypothetical protein